MTKDHGHSEFDITDDRNTEADEGPVVLVVDDSPMVRSYHQAILRTAGFAVREAGNGYEALELCLAERFCLIVADVNMPVMDGYAFVEQVRLRGLFPEVPIIMISTEQKGIDTEEAFRRGANYYLVKPTDPEQLTLVARLLSRNVGSAVWGCLVKELMRQFLSEAHDLLEQVDAGLLQLERDPSDKSLLAEVFRAAHTLKGSSGLFDLPS